MGVNYNPFWCYVLRSFLSFTYNTIHYIQSGQFVVTFCWLYCCVVLLLLLLTLVLLLVVLAAAVAIVIPLFTCISPEVIRLAKD